MLGFAQDADQQAPVDILLEFQFTGVDGSQAAQLPFFLRDFRLEPGSGKVASAAFPLPAAVRFDVEVGDVPQGVLPGRRCGPLWFLFQGAASPIRVGRIASMKSIHRKHRIMFSMASCTPFLVCMIWLEPEIKKLQPYLRLAGRLLIAGCRNSTPAIGRFIT